MKTFTKVMIALIFGLILKVNLQAQNKQEELFIEPLNESEAYDFKGGLECNPGDIFITVKSNIHNLSFDSNVMDIKKPVFNSEKEEYVFCHSKESFWLTIGSPNHISKKTYIDGASTKYAFKIVSKLPKGKVYFRTNPNNALADFGFSGQSPHLTATPIEMNAGEYKTKISKIGYKSIDTLIVVPSDGTTKMVDITLKPEFSKIQLDITCADKTHFQIYPSLDIDTAHINLANMYEKSKIKSFDEEGKIEYFNLYSGGVIPLPPGYHNVTINAPGFQTFTIGLTTTKEAITPLKAELQPIAGFLTIVDESNSMDAKVFLDNELVGTVPLYKLKVRIGNHKIRIEKNGYITPKEDYPILIREGAEETFSTIMTIFKQYRVISSPSGSEILVDGQRQGFTPYNINLEKGSHEVCVRKAGFLDKKQSFVINETRTNSIDTINCKLELTYPISIKSERDSLNVLIKRSDEVVSNGKLTPAEIQLPYGKYQLELSRKGKKVYSGSFMHDGETKLDVPCYSTGTFTTFVADLFLQEPLAKTKTDNESSINYYNLFYSGQFGRFNLMPGLSTSLVRTSIFKLHKDFAGRKITALKNGADINVDSVKYDSYMMSTSIAFLNGEFRMGGSILKNLDICTMGTLAWDPDLTKIIPYSHISGTEVFLGIELATRISYLNFNVKFGKEIYNGNYNYLVNKGGSDDKFFSMPFSVGNTVLTIGVTLGSKVSKSNSMLRLWHKPLASNY